MATFILTCFVVFVLASIAKLIYEVQQNKKSIKIQQNEITADEVNTFQTLAGIKPHNEIKGTNDLAKVFETHNEKLMIRGNELKNVEFPAPDPSIPVMTAKLTTIELRSKEEADPLASVPLSRVSKEGKKKMAEIAKKDISERLEEKTKSIFPEGVEYTDEYFKSDYSKSKIKKKNPKQDTNGINESLPFKKTRKKATKKKKENE